MPGGRGRVASSVMPSVMRRMREKTEEEKGCIATCHLTVLRAMQLKGVSEKSDGVYVRATCAKKVNR